MSDIELIYLRLDLCGIDTLVFEIERHTPDLPKNAHALCEIHVPLLGLAKGNVKDILIWEFAAYREQLDLIIKEARDAQTPPPSTPTAAT